MDPRDLLLGLLTAVRLLGLAEGELPGLLHLLTTRRVARKDGTLVSAGLTWRQAAKTLAAAGWGAPPGTGPRAARWFAAACRAGVDSPEARAGAERLAARLRQLGYTVSAG
jgi:hypothetical protein